MHACAQGVESLAEAAHAGRPALERALSKCLSPKRAREAAAAAANVPRIRVEAVVRPQDAELASVTGGIGPSDVCEVHVTLASSSGSLPRGGKKMDSSWWLVLGDASGELHAVRRTFIGRRVRVKLLFEAPPSPGDAAITLYLISDALRGVDQQRTLPFTVVDPGDGGESVEEEEEEGDE